MSRLLYSPNRFSPWPKILSRDKTVDTDRCSGGEAEPKSNAGFNRSDRYPTVVQQPKTKSPSKVSIVNNQLIQGRRSSFGSTQQQVAVSGTPCVKSLDREKSGKDVQRLLKLRKRRLREAMENGDDAEVYRLKHLSLFDDIETSRTEDDNFENGVLEGSPNESNVVYEIASPITAPNVESLIPSPPFTHGHTSELCEHMKLQQACGALIPEEFSSCTVHPEPGSPTTGSAESSTCLAHLTTSRKSSKGSTESSFTVRMRVSTLSPSISESSRASLPKKGSSPYSEAVKDEDSFLYIAKYMPHRSLNVDQRKKDRSRSSAIAEAETRKGLRPRCTCSGHQCRTYLSGISSQHCSNCKIPIPQPEIRAAMERINNVEASAMSASDVGFLTHGNGLDVELAHDENLQQDVEIVQLYNVEMEKRCSRGVWWEGWLVVADLKQQGFVGSKTSVHDTTDLI
ncbi:hypothetical protein N7G274_007680 [Stereocaulon virgatum]|uniref:Post-SET domain-containing protein n=1 Tax=Stereocaulon virgatum TaxID=373712 RepID=A0ABR4A2Z3_9LECA